MTSQRTFDAGGPQPIRATARKRSVVAVKTRPNDNKFCPTSVANFTRRQFSKACIPALTLAVSCPGDLHADEKPKIASNQESVKGTIGLVSASAHAQTSGRAQGRNFSLLEMPKILREELDLTVLDLNTMSFPAFDKVDATYIDKLRNAADAAGCVLTNLKMNQRNLQMDAADPDTRRKAITEYKRSIDIAAELGCRWARPLPRKELTNRDRHVAGYQELCDYAANRNVQLLVENFGWMQSDPDSVPDLIKAIGHNVAACPDTGNWNGNDVRYQGLKNAFPLAVTCDFKAKQLGPNGEHAAYDMKRCFDIAWNAGFRGPWAIEHGNADTAKFLGEVGMVRDMLQKWMAQKKAVVGL